MKNKLILLTGAYRLDNLYLIAKSIYKNFDKYHPEIDYTWLICFDEYNAKSKSSKEEVSDSIQFIKNLEIINSGKPNQKNYGGDLFNDPLKNYISKIKDTYDDIWVYVLDDDNIVNYNLPDQYLNLINIANQSGSRIIWLNIIRHEGSAYVISKDTVFTTPDFNKGIWYWESLPDPSQLLINFELLERIGYFKGGSKYDNFFWNYLSRNPEEIIYASDLLGKDNYLIQCTHNGLKPNYDKLDEALEKVIDPRSIIRLDIYNGSAMSFEVPAELAKDILLKIKEYYEQDI